MNYIIVFFLLFVLPITSIAQKINYSIPQGYESDISKEDYKKFVDMAVPIIAQRYQIEFVKDGTVHLVSGQNMKAFNLDNLILKCAAVKDKSQWEIIVKEHFNNLFSSFDEQKKIDPANYDSIKKYFSLRIYPAATIENRGGVSAMIAKTDLEGTYTLLMLDLPGAFVPVQKKVFDLWKKDTSEVFKIAQENVNKQAIDKQTKVFEIDNSQIEISFLGNEDYAASYALDLINNSPDLVGEWGSAVAIPNKGLVDICKISKSKPLDFVKFIQSTKSLIEQAYKEHPQPISNQYFWYYKGVFTRIYVLTKPDGSVNVISPYGLTSLMTTIK